MSSNVAAFHEEMCLPSLAADVKALLTLPSLPSGAALWVLADSGHGRFLLKTLDIFSTCKL